MCYVCRRHHVLFTHHCPLYKKFHGTISISILCQLHKICPIIFNSHLVFSAPPLACPPPVFLAFKHCFICIRCCLSSLFLDIFFICFLVYSNPFTHTSYCCVSKNIP